MSDLICGKAAVGGNYNSTRDRLSKIEDRETCLREIAEAGFSHIHWCFEWTGDYIYSKAEMGRFLY